MRLLNKLFPSNDADAISQAGDLWVCIALVLVGVLAILDSAGIINLSVR